MDIGQFRQQYPQYNDLPDEEVVKRLHDKFHQTEDYNAFRSRFLGHAPIEQGRAKSIEKFGPPGKVDNSPDKVVNPTTNVAPEATPVPEMGAIAPKMGTPVDEADLKQSILTRGEPSTVPWREVFKPVPAQVKNLGEGALGGDRLQTLQAELEAAKRGKAFDPMLESGAIREPMALARAYEELDKRRPRAVAEIEADIAAALEDEQARVQRGVELTAPLADASTFQKGVNQALTSMPISGAALVAGIATRSAPLAAMSLYPVTQAESYGRLRAQGVEHETAIAHSRIQGTAESATELVPFHVLLKRIPGVSKLLYTIGGELGGETLAQLVQGSSDYVAAAQARGAPVTGALVWDGIMEAAQELPVTWVATALGSAAQTGAVTIADKVLNPQPTEQEADLIRRANETYVQTLADSMAELSGQKMPQSMRQQEAARRAQEAALQVIAEYSPADAARLRLNKLEKDAAAGKTVDPAQLQEAREAVEQATVESVRGKLREGKLTPEQQQEAARALRDMDSTPEEGAGEVRGVVRPEKPTKGQPPAEPAPKGVPTAKPDAPLSEVETARQDALNRVANADTIEEGALNDLIAEGLAKINPQTRRPVLLPPGKRQRSALNKRAEAAELAEKEISRKEDSPAATKPAKKSKPVAQEAQAPAAPAPVVAEKPQPKRPKKSKVVAETQQPTAEAAPVQDSAVSTEREQAAEMDETFDRDGPEADFTPARPIEAEAMEEPGPGPAFATRDFEGEQETLVGADGKPLRVGDKVSYPASRVRRRGILPREVRVLNITPEGLIEVEEDLPGGAIKRTLSAPAIGAEWRPTVTTPTRDARRLAKRIAEDQENERITAETERQMAEDLDREIRKVNKAETRKKLTTIEGGRQDKPAFAVAGDPETTPAGFKQDNPALRGDENGKKWLADKQRYAEEDMETDRKRGRVGPPAGPMALGLNGATTAWVDSIDLPTEEVAKLRGVMGEKRVPGESQYDRLMENVRAEGFNQEKSPILIVVNHKGEPYILEGNTRTAVGKAIGAPTIRAEIRWYNGGEMVDGPFSPANVKRMTEPQEPAPAPIAFAVAEDLPRNEQGQLLAPNGKPSKLAENQWRQVRTPEFKAWFGDWEKYALMQGGVWNDDKGEVSKVVDPETGEPMVVYHGTTRGGFRVFDKGNADGHVTSAPAGTSFFTNDRAMAATYSNTQTEIDISDEVPSGFYITQGEDGTWYVGDEDDSARTLSRGFATREEAVAEARKIASRDGQSFATALPTPIVRISGLYSVFLNIRRPNEHDFEGANWDGSRDHQWVVVPVGTDDESESGLVEAPDGTRYFEERDEAERLSARTPGTTVANAGYYFMHDSTNQVVRWDKESKYTDGSIIRNVIDEGQYYGGSGPNDVFVAFDPTQIKSATQNRGTFDPKNPDITFATNDEEVRAKAFYSALTLAGENAKMTKGSAAQWYGALKNTPGVKQEELDWSGVKEWLGDRKSVTKDEVIAYLRANQLLITEQELVAPEISIDRSSKYYSALSRELRGLLDRQELSTPYQIRLSLSNDGDTYRALTKKFPELTENEDWEELVSEDLIRIDGQRLSETTEAAYLEKGEKASKYADKQLPGGSNYRMILLQLPDPTPRTAVRDARVVEQAPSGTYYVYDAAGAVIGQGDTPEAAREHARKMDPNAIIADTFRSPHFLDDRNVVAHIRLNDRTDVNGNRFLFAETIQSDWHQQGRREGYRSELPAEGLPPGYAIKRLPDDQLPEDAGDERGWYFTREGLRVLLAPGAPGSTGFNTREDAIASARMHHQYGSVPDAPFKTTWPELVMKRLIRYAAENGYDGIGWTTGAQQAARWGEDTEEGMVGFYDEILPHAASKVGKKYGAKVDRVDDSKPNTGPQFALTDNTDFAVDDDGTVLRGRDLYFHAHGMLLTPELKTAALGGFPMFAVNRAGQGLPAGIIERAVRPAERLLGVPITVLPDPKSAPKHIAASAATVDRRIAGVYDEQTKRVYLFANGIDTTQQAVEFYAHEVVGHKGLRSLLGPNYHAVMQKIIADFKPEVLKAQEKNAIGEQDGVLAPFDKLSVADQNLSAEESVAYAAQALLGKRGLAAERSRWHKMVTYVVSQLRKIGMFKKWRERDLHELIYRARDHVRREASRKVQRAYEAKVEKARDKAITIPKPDPVNDGPLLGMPTVQTIPGIGQVKAGPFAPARRAAAEYKRRAGIRTPEVRTYAKVNEENAKRIARAYQNMKHDPLDPRVKAAYDAMVRETLAQYQAIKATGLKIEFISDGQDPYAASPRLAIEDVRNNNHLWVFPTDSGFGMDADAEYMKNNPLLQPTNEFLGRRQLLANDVFRIVHDYFGHIQEGNGFRADGEENAWRIHASMYSPLARAAMTSETRGQNSWLNFGPHGKKNRKAKNAETVYAEQKIGLLPPEFWNPEPETAALAVRSERVTSLPSRELALRARRLFQRTIDAPESGFSLDVYGNAPPNEGYTVSTDKGTERIFTMIPTADEMAAYIDQYRDRLEAGGQFFGGWRAGPAGTNRYVLDVSQWFADHDEAREAAKAAQQEAIFDLAKMETEYLTAPTFAVADPIDSPAFKRWFGDSKVVDENGKPLVVYHGTDAIFSVFKYGEFGFHFGTKEQAQESGKHTMPVYLSLRNPIRFNTDFSNWGDEEAVADYLVQKRIITRAEANRGDLQGLLEKKGYDGYIYPNGFESDGLSYAVFNARQIKSANGNRGTFNPRSPNIFFAVADEVADTIRDIAKHLTPQERTRLNRSTARKLVDLFETLPDEKERGAVALAGAAARGWYRDSAETIADIFGPDAPRFAGLLAALSPQVSVQDNLKNAVALWAAWDKAGRPVKKSEIIKLMKGSLWGAQDRKGERVGVLPSWINNTVRALSVDDALNLVLSGPKVSSFAANLRNEVNEVTLDSWMAAFDKLDAKKMFGGRLNVKGDDPGKTVGYKAVAARIRQTAAYLTKMTGETWTPAEVQETIWAWTKTLTELAAKYGPLSSAEEIVKDGELTNELINATVNFATLFTLPEQQELLRNLGYGERIDRAVERAQARRSARGQAPALSGADQKRLLTAARRIDSMREDRPRAGVMGASRLDDIPFAVNEEQEAAFSVLGGNTGNADLDAFLGKIGDRKRSLGQMWQDWTENLSARAQMAVFDDLYGIKRAGDIAGVSAADVGFKNAHLAKSAAELTQAMIEYGYPVWLKDGTHMVAGVEGGQGLVDILKPLGEKVNLWAAWMVARRADRLMGEGRENLFEANEIAAALALGQQHPEFQAVADAYAAFQKKVLDFAQEAGIIDPDSRALWENADYIPFYRIIESGQIQGPNGGGVLGKVRNQIRKLKGGTANIGDPLENIARNWYSLMDASLKAHAARTVVDALDGSGLVTRAPQVEITSAIVPLSQIEKFIKNNPLLVQHLQAAGVDPAKLPPAAFAGLQKMLAVQPPSGEDIISVWRNGKREYWHVHDALLFESLMNVNKAAWGPLMEFFRFPKRFGTAMITTTAAFGAKNFFRDMLHTFIQGSTDAQTTIVPGLDSVKGAISQFRMDEASQALLAGGGSFTHGYIRAGDTAGAAATIRRALRKADPSSAVLDTPVKVFRFYRDLLNASENAHRVAIYSKMRAKGASRLDALYEARDLLDFAKRGNNVAIRFLTESVMFLNARMQGLYRLGRGASAGRAALSIALRGSLYMLGMLALLAFQHDDERYKALTDADKASYIHFFDVFREGDHYRLPVPFEVGTIFGTFPVAIMEALISDEPDAGRQALAMFGHAITQSLDLSPDIQVAMPILELAINKDTFTKAPILTMGDEAVLPEEQDDPRLSPTLRGLARAMPEIAPEALRSPKQLNHLVRGYTGPVLDYGLFVTDAIVRRAMGEPAPATKTLRDYPDIKAFVQTGPQRMTRYQNDMFDIADRAERVAASIRRLETIGTEEADARIDQLEAENFGLLNARDDFREAAQEVIDLRKTMREIQLDRGMTPEEKREELDALQNEINGIARDVWGMRPGGPLNPDIAVELIDKDVQGRIDVLNNNKLSATARALQELE